LTWQNIRQAKYQFPQYWDGISRDAKPLIKGLLTRDPNQRLMVDQALSHPWMIGRGQDMMGNPINLKKLKEFNIERVRDSNVSSVSYFWLLTRRYLTTRGLALTFNVGYGREVASAVTVAVDKTLKNLKLFTIFDSSQVGINMQQVFVITMFGLCQRQWCVTAPRQKGLYSVYQ
jgi:serine/threonine protein kinase